MDDYERESRIIEVTPIPNAAHSANLYGIDLNKNITPSLMKSRTAAHDARIKWLLSKISIRGLPLIYKNVGKASKIDSSD